MLNSETWPQRQAGKHEGSGQHLAEVTQDENGQMISDLRSSIGKASPLLGGPPIKA